MHPHAAGPLHQRLDNNGGHFPRVPRQGVIESLRGRRHHFRAKQQGLEPSEEERIPADRHRSEGVAVVTALQAHEAGALGFSLMAPVLIGHFEGDLDSRAAVIREEHPTSRPGSRAQEEFGQGDSGRVGDAGELDVVQRLGGLVKRGHQHGMPMSVEDRPPRGDAVDDCAVPSASHRNSSSAATATRGRSGSRSEV